MSFKQFVLQHRDEIQKLKQSGKTWREILLALGIEATNSNINSIRARYSEISASLSSEYQSGTSEEASSVLQLEKRYVYNPVTKAYITFLTSSPNPVVVPQSVHQAMLKAYSNWDGQPATINEICRQFGFTRQQFTEYKSIHGWTHDREPITDEEYLSEDYDENQVIHNLISQRRQALYQKFEKTKWDQIQKDAQKWAEFETYALRFLESALKEFVPPSISLNLSSPLSQDSHMLVLGTTDAHLGKLSHEGESTLEDDSKRLIDLTSDLLKRATVYNVEKIAFILGSDYLHMDTDSGTTTKGTFVDSHSSYQETLLTGCTTAITLIEMCKAVAPVHIVSCPGNHDRVSTWFLNLFVYAWYKDDPDVHVDLDSNERKYLLYGNSLLGFFHGDLIKKRDLSSIMAAEVPKLWGESKYRYWFQGHLHQESVLETGGVKIFQMPSPSSTDRWHYRNGYVAASQASSAYIVHPDKGVVSVLISPVD